MNEKQLTFEGVMRIVQGNKWILLKDIERLEKFIQNQQATIQSLKEENEQLKKSEKINMEYAEQIVEENQQLRIAKNDLRIENEQLHLAIDDLLSHTSCEEIKKENEQLRKQVKSSETTSDATSNYNAHLESKITTLEKENEQLKKKLESLQKVLHLVECVSDE